MALIANMGPSALWRRRAALLAELREAEPHLMKELDLVEEALERLSTPDKPYAHVHKIVDAVMLHLTLSQRWQTGRQISDALLAGGFRTGRTLTPYAIMESIYRGVNKKKTLIQAGDLIGLPEWEKPAQTRVEKASLINSVPH